jgi:flagellar hook-length control protein FliK
MNVASIMMQLGGLSRQGNGKIQSQTPSNQYDFTSILGSVFAQKDCPAVVKDQSEPQLNGDQLNELTQLLSSTDMSDLLDKFDGQELKFNSTTIANLLGISKSELKSVLQSLLTKLTVKGIPSDENGSSDDQKTKIDKKDTDPIDMILSIMNMITNLDPKELKTKDFSSLATSMKISKLVELLGKKTDLSGIDIDSFFQVKEKNEEILGKIKGFLQQADSTKKNTILENSFQSVLTDASAKAKPTDPINTHQSRGLNPVIQNDLQVPLTNTESTNSIQLSHSMMSKSEQLNLMVPKGTTPASYEQFVQDFSKVLESSQWVKSPNMSKLLIKLYPEQLGSLRIEILQKDGMMTARIMATSTQAKELLDSSLQGLKHSFGQQQIQVDKIEVIQSMTETERFQRQGSNQQQSQQQQEKPHTEKDLNTDLNLDSLNFQELLLNVEV